MNLWTTASERLWEAIFSLIASLLIALMGIGMLKTHEIRDLWESKINAALERQESGVESESNETVGPAGVQVERVHEKNQSKFQELATKFNLFKRENLFFFLPLITL